MYKYHCSNLRQIDEAIKVIQRDLRRYISKKETQCEDIYTKLLSHLVTCWMEVKILKVIYEHNAFTFSEIGTILDVSTLQDKWVTALNFAMCKAYGIPISNESEVIKSRLSFTSRVRYQELLRIIKDIFVKSIEVRNRLAHGQWEYAFTNDLRNISSTITGRLRLENIISLQLNIKLFKSLAELINSLAVSPPTFERDFDLHYTRIEQQTLNLHNREYENYKTKMIDKYQRGLIKRKVIKDSD